MNGKCAVVNGDFCLSRIGIVITEAELKNPKLLPDIEFCKYKKGDYCECQNKRQE